jgi:hypothetical protein
MLRGSRHLGTILGYSFSPIKVPPLAATVGTLENRVYNKPNAAVQPEPWLRALITNLQSNTSFYSIQYVSK